MSFVQNILNQYPEATCVDFEAVFDTANRENQLIQFQISNDTEVLEEYEQLMNSKLGDEINDYIYEKEMKDLYPSEFHDMSYYSIDLKTLSLVEIDDYYKEE